MAEVSSISRAMRRVDREKSDSPDTTVPMASASRPVLDNVTMPRTGLQLPYRLPFDAWLDVGTRLAAVVNSSAWCLGDWLVYGEVNFTGRYREAIERTSLDYQTLRNYAWVARKFPLPRRREKLSFGHHAEVAALPEPEQEYWLRKAEELGWSRNQTRHEIRTSLRERNAAAAAPENDLAGESSDPLGATGLADATGPADATGTAAAAELTIRMKVTSDRLELYRNAASQGGYSIEDWALLILDRAAHNSAPASRLAGTAG